MHAKSPPSRGRGLKHNLKADITDLEIVAPFTGARIETQDSCTYRPASWSPPSRGRGLKRFSDVGRDEQQYVAPFTGARIETS